MRAPKSIRILTTVAVLLVFLIYFLLNTEKFTPLLHVNVVLLVLITVGNIISIAISGLFTKFILRPFNKHIPLRESFYVSLISSVGNFFAPVGAGFGFRAVYLKRKFGVPYSEYVSSLSGNYILVFLVNSAFGLLSLYLLRGRRNSEYGILLGVFSVIFLLSLALSLFKIPLPSPSKLRSRSIKRLIDILYRIMHGWNHILAHKKLMVQLIFLTFAALVLNTTMVWMEIHALHLSVSFAPLVLFSVLGSLSLFINITPANLGVKEAIFIFSSHVLGFTTAQILSIALIDRGVLFGVLLLLWMILSGKKRQGRTSFLNTPA